MTALRNGKLYRRLCELVGKEHVDIQDAGVAGEYRRHHFSNQPGDYRFEMIGDIRGEQFRINCPFCGDSTKRCWLHHLYATPEENFEHGFIRLWRCFNEECQATFENRKKMMDWITAEGDMPKMYVDETVNVPAVPYIPRWPGTMQSFAYLIEKRPNHDAIRWAIQRNYSLNEMRVAGVCYCQMGDDDHAHITGRLVVPFLFRAPGSIPKLAGWTARTLKTYKEMDESEYKPAKWMHSRAPTRTLVYGLNEAAKSLTTVIVEGPGDRFGFGRSAACILGKSLKPAKARVIAQAIAKYPADDRRSIVILLDPDQSKDAADRGEAHHIETSVKVMQAETDIPVVGAYLPKTTDPGVLMRYFQHAIVARELKKHGLRCFLAT